MNLKLIRKYKKSEYVIGELFIDGEFFCNTLEDLDRGLKDSMSEYLINSIKIKDKTAIPTGVYKISLDVVSPKYSNFSKYKWAKDIEGKVPRLLNVKGFEGILIHPGNTLYNSSGCVLVGRNKVKGKVVDSIKTFKELYRRMKESNDIITIEIQ